MEATVNLTPDVFAQIPKERAMKHMVQRTRGKRR